MQEKASDLLNCIVEFGEETMMVREYLKSVLHEIEEQRKANTAEIEEQRLEKETIDKKIARIQSKKEFDMEYFSPRRSEGSLREQLADLQKNNMILKEELRKLEEEEQQLEKKQENFRKMLEEVEELEKKAKK